MALPEQPPALPGQAVCAGVRAMKRADAREEHGAQHKERPKRKIGEKRAVGAG